MYQQTKRMNTPWGAAQDIEQVSDDITSISTASHGGYRVAGESWKKFRELFPDVKLWAGCNSERGWFEEDCDWALVVLAFPEYFVDKGEAIPSALCIARQLDLSDRERLSVSTRFGGYKMIKTRNLLVKAKAILLA